MKNNLLKIILIISITFFYIELLLGTLYIAPYDLELSSVSEFFILFLRILVFDLIINIIPYFATKLYLYIINKYRFNCFINFIIHFIYVALIILYGFIILLIIATGIIFLQDKSTWYRLVF